jgi:FkbM family methyltransferase
MNFSQIIYKLIYQQHINYVLRNINYCLSFIIKKIKIPPSGILYLNTDSGTVKILTNQTSYLTQLLFWKGYKKFEYSDIFEKLSKNIGCFFDIGSNIGYYSLLAVKANPKIKAYAFEPAIGPKYFLKKNIAANSFEKNILPIDLALSRTNGIIDFYEVENVKYKYLKHNLAGEGNAGTKTKSRSFIKNSVEAKTLNQFVFDEKIKKIDLIKLDTEGTEIDILNSGIDTIVKFEPIIICETLFDTIENELDEFFSLINYEFYNHTENGLEKVTTIKRTIDNGIRNCFFVPKSKLYLIKSFIHIKE